MNGKKMLCILLAVLLLLPACTQEESEDPAISPGPTIVIAPGEPNFEHHDKEFQKLVHLQYGDDKIIRAEVQAYYYSSPPYDCFLDLPSALQPFRPTAAYWMEDGQEVCYALSGTAELTAEQRLSLEKQLQVYAMTRGLRYSYFYSQHFMVVAVVKENPELWVHFAIEAYRNAPGTVYVLDEAEIRVQHQVLLEHAMLEIEKRMDFA